MSDSFTEISEEGLGSRLMSAIKGVVFGLVLFGLAFPVLFWNEGRAVKRDRDLQEGAGSVVSISADQVDAAHEGRLVHLSGHAETDDVLQDPTFGISVNAIHLTRNAEMYQWVESEETEKKRKVGGSETTTTTYTYTKEWSDEYWDTADFRKPEGHANPADFPHASDSYSAEDVRLGAFQLSPSLIYQIEGATPLAPPEPPAGAAWHVEGERIYVPAGGSAAAAGEPQIGDVRIRFEVVTPSPVSVVALQDGNTFSEWVGGEGSGIEHLAMGTQNATQMFSGLEAENALFTWILRGVGFLMMAIGLAMLLAPFAVMADVIPFLGDMMRFGTTIFAGTVAACLSLTTIAAGWVAYRPLVGVPLLVLALAVLGGLLWAGHSRKRAEPGPEQQAMPASA